jgi:hypothetical protein
LAGDGDVFAAAGMAAVGSGRLGNRPRYFIRIDKPVGGRLRELPRLAIGQGGMRAAFLALGETLVDPIAVGLMKTRLSAYAAEAPRRSAQANSADVDRMLYRRMGGLPHSIRSKTLRMINHRRLARVGRRNRSRKLALDAVPRAAPW